MIFRMDDIMPELYEEFSEIPQKGVRNAVRRGLKGVKRWTKANNELILKGPNAEIIKFFIPMKPEEHRLFTWRKKFQRDRHKKWQKKQQSTNSKED